MTINEMSLRISYRLWLFSYSLFFMVCCKCLRFRKKRALFNNRLGRDMQGVQQEPENFRGETCLKGTSEISTQYLPDCLFSSFLHNCICFSVLI